MTSTVTFLTSPFVFVTDIYHIVATSRNYSELELVWKGWRDASGRRMKGKYVEFVSLSNHAIQDLNQGN